MLKKISDYGAHADVVVRPLNALFNMLSGYSEPLGWNHLALAPLWLKDKFLYLIEREKETTPHHKRYFAVRFESHKSVYYMTARLLQLSCPDNIVFLGFEHLKYKPYKPQPVPGLEAGASIFEEIKERDILLHHLSPLPFFQLLFDFL